MITADFVALITVVASIAVGAVLGFGKCLKTVTKGTVGIVISVAVCYFIFGLVLNLGFVKDLLDKFNAMLGESGSGFCAFLIKIHIDMLVFAVALFLVVQVLRKLIFSLICDFMESDQPMLKTLNKVGGAILFFVVVLMFVLIFFQVCAWIGGTEGSTYEFLQGSALGLDRLYLNNPLNVIFERIRETVEKYLPV